MALTITAAANALTTIGLERTIIARKFETRDELKAHLDTVWSAELIRSVIVTLLVTASAFPMARFYGQAELRIIIPILAFTNLAQGLQNIGLVLLRKEISFVRIFWFELATNLGGAVLTVALALVLKNVWALVIGMLLSAALGTALSYVFHPFRPALRFDRLVLTQALHFGKFALLFAVASYVSNMADNIVAGRSLGTTALGNYSLAFNIASAPIIVVVFSVSAVLLPAYAELNSLNPAQLAPAFTRAFNLTLLLMTGIAVPLYLFANEIVAVLFGRRWRTAGSALGILALAIPLRGLTLISSTVFWSANRPKEVASARTLDAIVFVIVLYPFVRAFGLSGVAYAVLLAYTFACLNRVWWLNKIMPGISAKLLRILLPTLALLLTILLVTRFASR